MGYKFRSLERIKTKGLPSVVCFEKERPDVAVACACGIYERLKGHWAVRVDRPINDGSILPLFGSNKKTMLNADLTDILKSVKERYPDCTFLVSDAPDDSTREANIVCWRDGDYLFGEIGFQPMTLRDAWIRGRITPFVISGGPGDVIRNKGRFLDRQYIYTAGFPCNPGDLLLESYQFRLDYLRKIRDLIFEEGYEYEISVMNSGRIIFWQETFMKEDRSMLLKECLF